MNQTYTEQKCQFCGEQSVNFTVRETQSRYHCLSCHQDILINYGALDGEEILRKMVIKSIEQRKIQQTCIL